MAGIDYDRFRDLTFEDFRRLAKTDTLSRYEKIGFPNAYREGREESIFQDITSKLGNLSKHNQIIIDIGPGCSGLPILLIELCRERGHSCQSLFEKYGGRVDAILAYSVLHYVFAEGNVFEFLDRSLSLLAESGEMLIGDIPNISKRKRFFSSQSGIRFHRQFTGSDEIPAVEFNRLEAGKIDDAVILSLVLRCRHAGFDAYWLPQGDDLPMANRREDILIRRP
jgi:hypothetical protein